MIYAQIKAMDFSVSMLLVLFVYFLLVLPSLCFTFFLFGDSLVDTGNNDYLFTLSKADFPPYGIDFKPSGGLPTGRFTNGRTVSDLLGEALGGKSYPSPFLAPNTQTEAIHRGVNYASGSSGILDETGFFFIGRLSLREQVSYFEQSKAIMVTLIGQNDTNKLLKKSIFSLTIGSNDILNYIQPSIIPILGNLKVPPNKFQDLMVSDFIVQLKRLHELGARKFIVAGIGPLGCIPYVRALNLIPIGECSVVVNELIEGYNGKLKEALVRLNQEIGPDSIFAYANSYDIVLRIILNHGQYGFENGYEPCCGGNIPPFQCSRGNSGNSSTGACKDRSKYVFWDAFHPTEAANVIIARELLDGDKSVISPMNVHQLHTYNIV